MTLVAVTDSAAAAPATVRLVDYRPPAFWVDRVDLTFDLDATETRVRARLAMRRNDAAPADAPLALQGRKLTLVALSLNDRLLSEETDFVRDEEGVTLFDVPDRCVIAVETLVRPKDNADLEGLYFAPSSEILCTQCEAEGFRRITFFPDRPDVLARYSVTLIADPARFPVLLSNGDLVASGDTADGRHFARWDDPHPKPSYLFALVAGALAASSESFTTASGRSVALNLYVKPRDVDKTGHALLALKRAMAWDEQVYGLEYDLGIYNIVAVGDFNMGAMENKGLNVFNTKYVLADPFTATDGDFQAIETVVAHEYFHNWTGNRITCRDWFQLSLKEGLTVFRDQQFSADMGSAAVKRISDVRSLRARQFPEDAGPTAHPVRPESYMEINNFYTATVYDKGAELCRMLHVTLGVAGFRAGMDLYVQRHDGSAATVDDFVQAMQDANNRDLSQFRRWWSQAGTPRVTATGRWLEAEQVYALTLRQSTPPTPGQPHKAPLHLPIHMALLDPQGHELPLRLAGEDAGDAPPPPSRVLELTEAEQTFRFTDVDVAPVPSLLRGFSAPVLLETDLDDDDLAFLCARDPDPFARWEAGQALAVKALLAAAADWRADRGLTAHPKLIAAAHAALTDAAIDPAFAAQLLTLPGEAYLGELATPMDVEAIHAARRFAQIAAARALIDEWRDAYARMRDDGSFSVTPEAMGRRALKAVCLEHLMLEPDGDAVDACLAQLEPGRPMTDALAALQCLADSTLPERDGALLDFYRRWADEPLVVDKWFLIQARSARVDALDQVKALAAHPAFDLRNPNKVYALIGGFANGNRVRFHAADGAGYAFLAEMALAIDRFNGKVAARLLSPLAGWRRFDAGRGALMRAVLERIAGTAGLSRDCVEIAGKSLL